MMTVYLKYAQLDVYSHMTHHRSAFGKEPFTSLF
jgi:hypothetical protein